MNNLDTLLRNRLGLKTTKKLEFKDLTVLLEKMAKEIPFENLCVIENRTMNITEENLMNKILKRNEGGLCYELNTLLHLFLKENGFHSSLIRGVTYDHSEQQWSAVGKTHVTIIISYLNQQYLVDTGFGGNLPLKPVPLTGEMISSKNGEFRIEKANSEYGNYYLYMKLKHKHNDWKLGYVFDTTNVVDDISVLNEVQNIILEHPQSRFNKRPLITKQTDKGNITLTDSTFTEWLDADESKIEIDKNRFKELLEEKFSIKSMI